MTKIKIQSLTTLFLSLSFLIMLSPPADAAAGDLDPTFGAGGKVTIGLGNHDAANASALQSDGKTIVVGRSRDISEEEFAVARYNSDGSLDTTFSGDGRLTTNLVAGIETALSVAVQSDWKIVVGGIVQINYKNQFALVRYNADGTIDTTFGGGDGIVTTNINGGDTLTDIAIQPDGKIVALGFFLDLTVGASTSEIVRYNPSGTLDTAFGSNGIYTFSLGGSPQQSGSVALQVDGKIVVCGKAGYGMSSFVVARLNANGGLDSTFDGDGIFRLSLSTNDAYAQDVAIQTDGKIVAVGSDTNTSSSKFLVIRLNPNGTLDTTFDGDGIRATDVGGFASAAYSVAIQPDGLITVSGTTKLSGSSSTICAAIRQTATGALDPTLDADGILTDSNMLRCNTVLTSDGKTVFSGTGGSGLDDDFAVTRHYSDGSFDTTWSGDGATFTNLGRDDDKINAVAMQTDGKILVAGYRERLGPATLARFNADGTPDASFGVGGFVADAAHGGHKTYFKGVAVQTDGKIVAAGYFIESGGCTGARSWVVRYNANGTRDTTFGGGDGAVEWYYNCDDSYDSQSYNNALAIQTNGKIVVAGSALNSSKKFDFAAARLNADGSFDTTFSGDGKVIVSVAGGDDEAYAIDINPRNGRILLGGYAESSTIKDFSFVMLTASGALDTSFDGNGILSTNTGGDDAAYAVAFQTDGKILAAGRQANGSNMTDFSLVRYLSNGALDTTFDGDGKVVTAFSAYYDPALGIALQSNGKAVAAGYGADNNNLGTSYNFALARYNTNGALDATFSGDGKQMTDFNANSDQASAVAIQADGKIVVAGHASNGNDFEIALARYLP